MFNNDMFSMSVKLRVFIVAMADLLSSYIRVGDSAVELVSSAINYLSQTDSWVALAIATYSASAVDSTAHLCFLLF